MRSNKTFYAFFILVLFIASFFRLFDLPNNPPGFFCDEASIGYNAYLIAHNARDEYGMILPFFFESFGDFKPGIPVYMAALFNFFEPTELTTRLPFALTGIILVFLFYQFGKVTRTKSFGIVAALIASLTPWTIHYSRIAFEVITYPTLLVVSFIVFFKSAKNAYLIPVGYVLLGLTFYTYRASFIQTPLIAIFLTILFLKDYRKHLTFLLLGLLVFFFVSIPFILSVVDGTSLKRVKLLAPPKETSFIEKVDLVSKNYSQHFSFDFLFSKGDDFFITRHFLPGFPPLLLPFLPLFLIGFISILHEKKRITFLVLFLLVIYPLAGSLTQGPPFTSRSILGIIPFIYLISEGLMIIYRAPTKKMMLVKVLVFLWITLSVFRFADYYFTKYPRISSDFWGWQYGAREIIEYFVEQEHSYDELIMAPEFNTPEVFFKFYAPTKCQKCAIGLPDSHYSATAKQLYALPPTYLQNHPEYSITEHKKVFQPNGSVAFIIGEVVQ